VGVFDMPKRPSTFTQSDVVRAVKAARAAGLDVGTVEVTQDGTFRFKVASEDPATHASVFDEWKVKRNAG
jgi:hypothetical protein